MRQWVVLLLAAFMAIFGLLPNVFGETQVMMSEKQVTLTQASAGHYCIPRADLSALPGYATDYYNAHGGLGTSMQEKYGNVNMSATPDFYSNFMNYSPPTSYGSGGGGGGIDLDMSCEGNFIFDFAGNNFFNQSPYLGSAIEICSAVTDHYDPGATKRMWCVYGVVENGSPFLEFPLEGYTPYDATISSVFDHSTSGGFYDKDGKIRAYDGEEAYDGAYTACLDSCSIKGYRKDSSGTPFSLSLLGGYDDDDTSDSPDSPKNILWYDGHPGYDYPASQGTDIKAAHSGILCVASNRTSSGGGLMWRASAYCPRPQDVVADGGDPYNDSWDRWHTFYIVYPDTSYSTWYLHAGSLSSTIESDILSQGYSTVTQGDVVAAVGNQAPVGVSVGYHLHFEVRVSGVTPVDPYGNGSSNILWEDEP